MKRLLLVPFLLLPIFWSSDAGAIDEAACCLQSTSFLDAEMNPVLGSDEKFFSKSGGPPNVMFILDTSSSMQAWPKAWPTTKGCGHGDFAPSYDPSKTYPKMKKGVQGATDIDAWFDTGKFYKAPDDGYGADFTGNPKNTDIYSTADSACAITGISDADKTTCKKCLVGDSTTPAKGYYVHFGGDWYHPAIRRVSGNFLNYFSPRDSGAVHVLTNIIHDLREVRMGILTFSNHTSGNDNCWATRPDPDYKALCLQEKMNPTCSKSYPLDQSSVDSNRGSLLSALTKPLYWSGSSGVGTPLADSVYAAATHLRSTSPDKFSGWPKPSSGAAAFDELDTADKKSICFTCSFNAIILLTDGDPTTEGRFVNLPDVIDNQTCTGDGCTSPLPKVTKYLYENDLRLDLGGKQNVATYTIGFSEDVSDSALLKKAAELGGGEFYPATSTDDLRRVILEIIDDIVKRNTSFSATAISSMQTGSTSMAAIMPRMMPSKDAPWRGELWRFSLWNEFVMDDPGATPAVDGDKNGDGDLNDVYVVDAAGDIISEDSNGAFVKKTGGGLAEPHWEARSRLLANGHASRKIWTVLDSSGPSNAKDGALTQHDALVSFDKDNASELIDYLGIKGTGYCPTSLLAGGEGKLLQTLKLGVAQAASAIGESTPATTSDFNLLCAKVLIQFIRGQDLGDEDGDGDRADTRPSVLGDIFHSSPATVDPPIDRFICDLALHNQCVRTLYSESVEGPTPLEDYAGQDCANKPVTRNAYDKWAWDGRFRDKVVLVGANDGMVHAFNGGKKTSSTCAGGQYVPTYDEGSGDEAWAFIPPDLLPRLRSRLTGHSYFVDGDIMVRDIWADENADGKKQSGEYHTLAIFSEGRGGTHYFALEVGFETTQAVSDRPGFRWMFPQPCSLESMTMGKTIYQLSPKPPPLGPVLIDSESTGLPGIKRHGSTRSSTERWMAMLSGGWSPGLEKGRGVYMVDAWFGQVMNRADNLWWKFDRADRDSTLEKGEQYEPRKMLTHSVVAPASLIDYGANDDVRLDGFFDTAIFGDTRGQLWLTRFFKPGKWNSTDKIIENWAGARAFEPDRYGISTGADPDDPAITLNLKSVKNDWPIYYPVSVGLQPDNKALRVYVGTGDRYAIKERNAGMCRFDNPLACSKYGCDKYKVEYKIKKGDYDLAKAKNEWKDLKFEKGELDWNSSNQGFCGSGPGTTTVEAQFTENKVDVCPAAQNNTISRSFRNGLKYLCGQDANGDYACRRNDSNPLDLGDIAVEPDATSLSTLGKNRFYGVWVYGGQPSKVFDETKTSFGGAEGEVLTAKRFDANRLTDRTTANLTSGDLVDVTNVTCSGANVCTSNGASADGNGWMLEYTLDLGTSGLEHKTGTGAALLSSCVMWSSIFPVFDNNVGNDPCSASVAKSRLYQADFLTGLPNCASGFRTDEGWARYQERDVVSPPPEPAVTVQISKTGQVKYSAMVPPEAGKDEVTQVEVSQGNDLLQSIYEIPVSRSAHQCRHGGKEKCVESAP